MTRPRYRGAALPLVASVLLTLSGLGSLSACATKARTEAIGLVNEGVRALNKGDLGNAKAYFARAARMDPTNAGAHFHLGLVQAYDSGDQSLAVGHFAEAARLAPDDPDILYQLGRCRTALGADDQALPLLDKAISHDPNLALAWYYKGVAHEHLGQLEEADAAWREACAIDPLDTRPFLALADLYDRFEAEVASRAVLTEGLRHNANNPDLLNALGVMNLRAGDAERAIEQLDIAMSRDAGRTDTIFNLAFAYAQAGERAKAIRHLALFTQAADPVLERSGLRVAHALLEALAAEQ